MRCCLIFLLFAACSGTQPPGPSDGGSHASAELKACAAIQEPARVTTIAAAVSRLNALPRPVSVACFVAGLPRPLELVASTSMFSAQPAEGSQNPRIFLMLPGLVISVAPTGDGARLLEFSQWITPTRTLKGELKLPLEAEVSGDAPYTQTHSNFGVTTCGLCHRREEAHPTIDGGFVSDAYRPEVYSLVPLSELSALHAACTEDDLSERCTLFHALFDFGVVRQGAFSSAVELFIQ